MVNKVRAALDEIRVRLLEPGVVLIRLRSERLTRLAAFRFPIAMPSPSAVFPIAVAIPPMPLGDHYTFKPGECQLSHGDHLPTIPPPRPPPNYIAVKALRQTEDGPGRGECG